MVLFIHVHIRTVVCDILNKQIRRILNYKSICYLLNSEKIPVNICIRGFEKNILNWKIYCLSYFQYLFL